jgi:hypothetical protein
MARGKVGRGATLNMNIPPERTGKVRKTPRGPRSLSNFGFL